MAKECASWSFESSNADFDGDRIMKEAARQGIQLLEIRRGRDWVVFWNFKYNNRLVNAIVDTKFRGFLSGDGWCPIVDYRSNLLGVLQRPTQYQYYARNVEAATIHEELLTREKILERNKTMRPRTTVRGYK